MSDLADATSMVDDNPHPPADSPGGIDLSFRLDVEGLRAVAVLAVVLYHSGVSWLPGGYVGVDVFFVISGFLITGLLLKEHESRRSISMLGFYARRARRILPAAMIVIVGTVLLSYFMLNFVDYGNVAIDGRWASLFAANIHFANVGNDYQALGSPKSPLLHYWSLAVEEQFYLVWPLLVILTSVMFRRVSLRVRVAAVAFVAVVASFIWSMIETHDNPVWAYFSPFTRAWELGLGALAACLVPFLSKRSRSIGAPLAWVGMAAIAVSACWFTDLTAFPGYAALLPVAGATFVIVGGTMSASGSRALSLSDRVGTWTGVAGFVILLAGVATAFHWSSMRPGAGVAIVIGAALLLVAALAHAGALAVLGRRPMRSIGRVSYGWYLLHWPLMILMVGPIFTHPLSVEENLIIAALMLLLAYRMFERVERPIRRSSLLARRPWLSIAMGACFVAGAFFFCYFLHPSVHHVWGGA